jgi:hypothetical protein
MAPLGRDPGMGAIQKKPEPLQKKGNDLLPSVTLRHDPLNNYLSSVLGDCHDRQLCGAADEWL